MSESAGQPEGLPHSLESSPADGPPAAGPLPPVADGASPAADATGSLAGDADALDPAAALFGQMQSEPSDDSPTVISKQGPRAVSSEEVLAGVLRGKTLAHFELLEAVGVGGMAAVLRARDTQLDRIVALKILPPEMAADAENIRRFHQEARSAAKLDHENIARVFFCGEDQKLHFIAFEYVEGENLRAVIDRHGRLPVGEAIHYMLQIATGLAHAASRGVVHRDIKPSNIIITPTGRAKLVDMGLARSLAPHHDGGLTQSGVTLGTFDYISPEQAIEPREADVRSDIYSLGCTFYHALTGQPPVPEGTAAKKLHHHQQVAPLDPRQLNPEIPDEVAAILARMMAKDPKARYQRPEHLVQHLLATAQKLGTPANLREGVLYVDAALPEPPRVRPFLLAAVGIAAVVALVLLFGSSSWTPFNVEKVGQQRPDVGTTEVGPGATVNPPKDSGDSKNSQSVAANPRPAQKEFDSPTLKELADFQLNNAEAAEYDIILTGDLWLTGEEGSTEAEAAFSLLAPGKKLTLRAKDATAPATIHIAYNPPRSRPVARWVGLLLRAEDVTLRDLRIVVDARFAATKIAGLVFQGSRLHALDCVFIQTNSAFADVERSTSVLIDGSRSGIRPQVTLEKCVFLGGRRDPTASGKEFGPLEDPEKGGQDAVTVAGSAQVGVSQCAFGPHAAPFVFEESDRASSALKLRECSAIMASGEWSAFRFADGASCEPLEVQHCLFARPDSDEPAIGPMMMEQPRKALGVLIRQAGLGKVRYEGRDNRYYHLDGFWLRPGDELTAGNWDMFRNEIRKQGGGKDEESRVLVSYPWYRDKPLDLLQQPDLVGNARDAFRLKENQHELRQKDEPTALVGMRTNSDKLPILNDPRPPVIARAPLVVDPTAQPGDTAYRWLNAALEDAIAGDVILIRHNGLLPLKLARLEKAAANVTIKPDPQCHPILTLDKTTEADAAMFTVHDGELTLDGLEFVLQPSNDKFQAQVLVKMAQNGACTFKDCVITLKDNSRVPLAVVALADPSRAMKMDKDKTEGRPERAAGLGARVSFDHCFVRGEGDLVWARVSRPFDLDCANSLVALNGSLLNVEAGREDAPAAAAGQTTNLKLSHLTGYLGGYLVRLKAGRDLKSLVPVHCKPVADCLFVAANKKTSLIHLDGPSSNEERMRTLVQWEGAKNNAYSDFDNMLDQQPPEESSMSDPPYGQDKWKTFSGETDSKFNSIKFADAPALDKLPQAKPVDFKLRDADSPGLGAEIDGLPQPRNPEG